MPKITFFLIETYIYIYGLEPKLQQIWDIVFTGWGIELFPGLQTSIRDPIPVRKFFSIFGTANGDISTGIPCMG
jgi:hypothetical protein